MGICRFICRRYHRHDDHQLLLLCLMSIHLRPFILLAKAVDVSTVIKKSRFIDSKKLIWFTDYKNRTKIKWNSILICTETSEFVASFEVSSLFGDSPKLY